MYIYASFCKLNIVKSGFLRELRPTCLESFVTKISHCCRVVEIGNRMVHLLEILHA